MTLVICLAWCIVRPTLALLVLVAKCALPNTALKEIANRPNALQDLCPSRAQPTHIPQAVTAAAAVSVTKSAAAAVVVLLSGLPAL